MVRMVRDRHIKDVELRLDDGRHISVKQRKKIYATLNDIAAFLGYPPEEMKEVMKYHYVTGTGKTTQQYQYDLSTRSFVKKKM